MPERPGFLDISDEVRQTLDQSGAVVAFESTIISHGMPYPQNLETAVKLEQTARDAGAVPATIAILDGRLKVGLSGAELEQLARQGPDASKISRRDLPFAVSRGISGGTTVAATMIIARMAGIKVFATGGIGGVHRGAQDSLDISADLEELARTAVAVVCAGPKAILDIGRTLEYLETRGVAVVGYRTDELPAFYTRTSGFAVDYRCDTAAEIAALLHNQQAMGLDGGMVIANPVPDEFALDPVLVESIIQQAHKDTAEQQVTGKNLTPFLLQRIETLSGGDSLTTNIQLIINNARLAAKIAVALRKQNSNHT